MTKKMYVGRVSLESDSAIGRKLKLSVGDVLVPFLKLTITVEPDDFIRVNAVLPAESINIVADHMVLIPEKEEARDGKAKAK